MKIEVGFTSVEIPERFHVQDRAIIIILMKVNTPVSVLFTQKYELVIIIIISFQIIYDIYNFVSN